MEKYVVFKIGVVTKHSYEFTNGFEAWQKFKELIWMYQPSLGIETKVWLEYQKER